MQLAFQRGSTFLLVPSLVMYTKRLVFSFARTIVLVHYFMYCMTVNTGERSLQSAWARIVLCLTDCLSPLFYDCKYWFITAVSWARIVLCATDCFSPLFYDCEQWFMREHCSPYCRCMALR